MGKILKVNLTSKMVSTEPLGEILASRFIGGFGIAAKILYDGVPPSVQPLDPENLLIFSTGPLTGTMAPGIGRHTVVTKSPLNGFFGDASAGGYWGAEFKFTGHDILVISGKSPKPTLLWIDDDSVEFRDASPYWGMDSVSTDREIGKDLGDTSIKIACIGQAGENLVKISGIVSDCGGAIAARCGVGAVMGSKNLKAVAVRGHKQMVVNDVDALKEIYPTLLNFARTNVATAGFSKRGTSGSIGALYEVGDTPAYNWSDGDFGDPEVKNFSANDLDIDKLNSPGGYDEIFVRKKSCYACPISCRRVISIEKGQLIRGPEYETISHFGPLIGNDDLIANVKMNQLCDEYGIDTISAGATLSFAMECYHRGLITKDDTDGLELEFGNTEAATEMLHRIAMRKGFGNVLVEGSRKASQIIGKGSEDYSMQVKGIEIAAHDPRAFQGGGPHYAATITGGRHTEGTSMGWEIRGGNRELLGLPKCESRTSTELKGFAAKVEEDWMSFVASCGLCWFGGVLGPAYPTEEYIVKVYSIVTGVPLTLKDALMVGERIFNLRKAFNMKHGATRADDKLPKRLLTQKNRSSGAVVELDKTLPDYYKARGWNPDTSMPTRERLNSLGLEDIAEDLIGRSKVN